MKCSDKESFKWAVTRALNPVDESTERVTKVLREQSKKYNWDGITFPTSLEQVKVFEENNNVLVNVFKFDRERDCVYPISVSTGEYEGRALLVFVDDRYAIVKTISRLLGGQAAKGKRHCERFFCLNCLSNFTSELQFDIHIIHLCEFAYNDEERRLEDGKCNMSFSTFSNSEEEEDFNEYIIRKINDDS